MIEHYPEGKDYEIMYKKYFHRSPLELINLVEINPEDNIADLCSGTGRLAKELLKFDCFVTCVDISTKMMLPGLYAKVFKLQMGIETFLQWCQEKYHGMFCQQAVNYWLNAETAKWLAKRIVPGGFFVFNTFIDCPPAQPSTREYTIDGKKYLEIVYHIDGIVHHVQCCEGYAPHVTKFAYISPKQFRQWLEPYFKLDEYLEGKTAIWKAVRL
jgi:SAM-dependent methyltransferase